ncbi:hypothetical protein D3C76_1252840 [compost metagenome]
MGEGDAAQAVGHQDQPAGGGGDVLLEGRHPFGALRREPVALLDPAGVGQVALPVALPVLARRALPARQDQVVDGVTAHARALGGMACALESRGVA